VGTQVELNPRALADKFGEPEEEVKKAIAFLCGPDPDTTSPAEEGRRLIKIGTFSYQVVNGEKYRAIKNEEERREQAREAMARRRAKLKEEAEAAKANGATVPKPGLTPEQQKRADAAKRKIAKEEEAERQVREKTNPDSNANHPAAVKVELGQSLRQQVNKQVKEDLRNQPPSESAPKEGPEPGGEDDLPEALQ
jgi:flagellar biosynthesis GTPase FlhF